MRIHLCALCEDGQSHATMSLQGKSPRDKELGDTMNETALFVCELTTKLLKLAMLAATIAYDCIYLYSGDDLYFWMGALALCGTIAVYGICYVGRCGIEG